MYASEYLNSEKSDIFTAIGSGDMHSVDIEDQVSQDEQAIVDGAVLRFCTPTRSKPTRFEVELAQSGQSIKLTNGLAATVWGDGPRVLLVHGWCGRGTQLGAFVNPLLEQGKSVVAIDCIGHGGSPGVQSNGVKFAESILAAESELGRFHYAIGHSLGAASILIALKRGLAADKVVLISPPSILNVMHEYGGAQGLSERLIKAFVRKMEQDSSVIIEEVDYRYIVPDLDLPILLIHDLNDKEVPCEDAEKYLAPLANITFEKTEGLGHLRIIRAPQVVAKTAEFLA